MLAEFLPPALVGLLPVLAFLAALLYLDSYKLVALPAVIAVVICGAMVAGISYVANAFILDLVFILIALLGFYFTDVQDFVNPDTINAKKKEITAKNKNNMPPNPDICRAARSC